MIVSKKKPPRIDDPDLSRVIDQIYDDINELINSVNQGNTSEERTTAQGKSGDIRLARLSNGNYELQGKTDDGWVTTTLTFKER
tara:strand:+ start:813 stop:1064 length:252 start_codon:yes stop_codon:yes gene_type:complete